MERSCRRSAFAATFLSLCGCQSREVARIDLEPPAGARSGVMALDHPGAFEVVAFDVDSPPELPYLDEYDQHPSVRLYARFYDEPLSALGVVAGKIPPRIEEEEFFTIPRSTAFPEDRTIIIEGELLPETWTLGPPRPPFSTFVSPAFGLDRQACFALETEATLQPDEAHLPSHLAGIHGQLALLGFGSGRSERLYALRAEGRAWRSARLDPNHFLSRLVSEKGSISFLAGDGMGGVIVGDCSIEAGVRTSTIWRSPSFEGDFEPFFTERGKDECPAQLLTISEDEWVMHRHLRAVVWLRRGENGLVATEIEEPHPRFDLVRQGVDLLGQAPGSQVLVYSDQRFVGSQAVPIEADERVEGLTVAGDEGVALAPKVTSGFGNSFYLRSPAGVWSSWTTVQSQEATAISRLYDSVIVAILFGQVLQLSRRDGECPEQSEARTGIYWPERLVPLDERTFVVAGHSSSADTNAPAGIAVLRARPKLPE